MLTTTVILIVIAIVIALLLAGLQYVYRSKPSHKYSYLLAALRAITFFAVFLIIINPKINATSNYIEKPNLVLLVDNSASIKNLEAGEMVSQTVNSFKENREIQDRFDLRVFTFGESLKENEDFSFSESHTNIHGALSSLGKLYSDEITPTVLITDGNQTYGQDYQFLAQNYENSLFPVIVGDTTIHNDISVTRVNVNRYAFLRNKFPVEIIVNYTGSLAFETKLQITSGSEVLFSKDLSLNSSNRSYVVDALLPATSIGVSTYKAEVLPLPDEKNILNNEREFAVEVIDERTSVLIITDVIHPDLGTLKKSIESNEQREAVIHQIGDSEINLNDYELVILYQPSNKFSSYFEELKEKGNNYFVISGPQTDWRFLNQVQEEINKKIISGQTEEYFPTLNKNYSPFQLDDFGISELPPLEDVFGEIEINEEASTILYQQIQGIETGEPLLATVEQESIRKGFLLGSNLWKWRAQVFMEENSFESFDNFIGKLVQFLGSNQRKERLSVDYENFYYSNEKIVISAQYFDENYRFDPLQQLILEMEDKETQETRQLPFSSKGNKYEIELNNLSPGEYSFIVKIEDENLSRSGSFTMVDFNVELQSLNSNFEGLRQVMRNRGEAVFFPTQVENLQEQLLTDKKYVPLQKSQQNNVPLIDWFYLLVIIVLSLSTEWFLRKYYGLV